MITLDTYHTFTQQRLDVKDDKGALISAVQCQNDYPDNPRAKSLLGWVHISAGRYAAALLPLQQSEMLDPTDAKVWALLGDCYNRCDDWYEAERYYRKVLDVDPQNISAMVNLEPILREQGYYDEVRSLLNRVVNVLPKIKSSVATSIACLDLMYGDFENGFQGYEERFRGFHHLREAFGEEYFPRWSGEDDITGKNILVRYEQGLGDTIQFSRYVTKLKELNAAKIGVLCKPVLHRLIATVPGVDTLHENRPNSGFDFEVMMMSMPAILKTAKESDIPNQTYMSVSDSDAKRWRERLAKYKGPKVGLVWSGELKRGKWDAERMNIRRSIPLKLLRPLLDADCSFFSLQKGERQKDLKDFYAAHKIHDFMDLCNDFYDTAGLISALDLVIAVDTSVAHVSGAMGKPVWMFSRLDGCWRWMLDRSDSPWYPSVKIYRQTQFVKWQPIIKQMAVDLAEYSEKFKLA